MIDFSISSGQLMLIWSFAGAICCLPFFTKNIWQRFFTVPIIFIAIWLSFYTNHEFIGRPMFDRPPEQFVYEHHAVVYLSLIHISEPTRPERIADARVGV